MSHRWIEAPWQGRLYFQLLSVKINNFISSLTVDMYKCFGYKAWSISYGSWYFTVKLLYNSYIEISDDSP